MNIDRYYAGTSNIVLPEKNKSFFPEGLKDKSRLSYYASLFNSLEVNSSFYRVPLTKTVERWAAEVTGDFRFAFKLWKNITHNKGLAFDPQEVSRFMQVINQAGHKAGSLLIQFPATITVTHRHQLERLLELVYQHNGNPHWDIAVEFRHRSWYHEEIYQLLHQYQAGMVTHDMQTSASPFGAINASFVYLRFHGPEAGYRGDYRPDVLAEYAQYIQGWMAEGKTVYVYFNNTLGSAFENLLTLNRLVRSGSGL